MPLITGPITGSGVVLDALVGVPAARRAALQRVGFAVPAEIPIRALVDTGANISGFTAGVFVQLGLAPHGRIQILTPSTTPAAPHECDLFVVSLSLVAAGRIHTVSDSLSVIVAEGWHPREDVNALIGRDILARCTFQYFGQSQQFTLSF